MDVLRYIHINRDYEVIVRTDDIAYAWSNFKGRINYRNALTHSDSNTSEYCSYSAKDDVSFFIYNPITDREEEAPIEKLYWPVVYETNKYQICIKFHGIDEGTSPKIIHILKEVEKSFFTDFEQDRREARLTGEVDFSNQPGLFKLNFTYQKNGVKKDAYITFDVVSPKLNTKHDYKKILSDVNHEFEGLIFNYLSTTFQQFGKGKEKNLEVWMQTFQQVVREYLKNVERIIKNPHSKVRTLVNYAKADRIKRWTPAMEEEYEETRHADKLDEHYFAYKEYETTVNSMENRFVKYTLKQIGSRLNEVFDKLLTKGNQDISLNYVKEWEGYRQTINKLQKHPFFKSVGKFEGLRQESLVLQSRMGYQQVYKDWLKLKKGIDFYNGTTNIGTLQIWEIYELWCFIKVKRMVRELMGFDPDKSDAEYGKLISEPNGDLIKYKGDKNTDYRVVFEYPNPDEIDVPKQYAEQIRRHQGETVSIHYQHTFSRRREDDFKIQTVTTEQRPDIVLNIKKMDGFVLTYLYDAKYRVWSDKALDRDFEDLDVIEQRELDSTDIDLKLYGADYPPSDAINQMHRYRDAIYYSLDADKRPDSKEIIGGYILFPGRGNDEKIKERYFYKSIAKVNIGAFPLLPMQGDKDATGRDIEGPQLWEHLKDILLEKEVVYSHISDSIPQRGLAYIDAKDIWTSSNVLLYVHPYSWDKVDEIKSVALGLNFNRFSLNLVNNFSSAKYVAIVSQHIPENKMMRLFKVEDNVEIVTNIDKEKCWKRSLHDEEDKEESKVYLEFKLSEQLKTPLLDAKKIHSITKGSHNPRILKLSDIIIE